MINFKKIVGAIALPLSLLAASGASALVVDGVQTGGTATGGFVELTSLPASVGFDNLQADTLYAFNEKQDYTLTADLNTGPTSIAAGTVVSSHYVAFDPASPATFIGSITFNSPILAVIVTPRDLLDSRHLGADGVHYRHPTYVGLENWTLRNDFYNAVGNVLHLDWWARSPGDHVRVITGPNPAPVPLPAPALMLLSGVGALAAAGRRRKG